MYKYGCLLVLVLMMGCQNSESADVHHLNNIWDKKNIQKFDFEIKNHQQPKNIIFVVRNNSDYPYSNLRIFANITQQKKMLTNDTLNYILAKPNGEWLGKGFGDTKEILFQYKTNYTFPQDGKYSIAVLQAMRSAKLKGIEDIGIIIETAKP